MQTPVSGSPATHFCPCTAPELHLISPYLADDVSTSAEPIFSISAFLLTGAHDHHETLALAPVVHAHQHFG